MERPTRDEPKDEVGWAGLVVGLLSVAACTLGGPRLTPAEQARQSAENVPALQVLGAGRPIRDARVEWQGEEALLTDEDGLVPWAVEIPARVTAPGWARGFAPAGTEVLQLARPALLAGQVVDTSGEPVAASVQAWRMDDEGQIPDELAHETTSNASGAFRFSDVGPGTVRVVVRADGFATESVVADVARGNLRVVLTPAGTLAGVVRDALGQPARAATVILAGSGVWPPREYTSDDDGRYRIDDIAPGVYELWARNADERSAPRSGIVLEAGDALFFPLQMVEGDHVAGIVVDASGTPIAGAEVLVADGGLALAPIRATTDDAGRFRIAPLLPVAYERTFLAQADGFLPGEVRAMGSQDSLRIELSPGATLRGRVVDERGRPVAGALVQWLMDRRPTAAAPGNDLGVTLGPIPPIPYDDGVPAPARFGDATSDEAGEFTITGVPAGLGELLASHSDYAPSRSIEADVGPGETSDVLTLILREGGILDGRLVDARGFPVRFVPVEVVSDESATPASRVSGEDGAFSFRGVLGTVTVSARPYDGPSVSQTVFIQAGDRQEIQLVLEESLAELHGRIVDERGFPVSAVEVSVQSAAPGTDFERMSVSEEDGTFSFIALPAPPYSIRADHPNFAVLDAAVAAGHAQHESVELVLAPGSDLVGQVLDEWSGVPVTGAEVVIEGADGASQTTVTDMDGRYRFARVLGGTYSVSVSSEGRAAEASIEVHGALVRIEALILPAAGGLELTIVDALGDRAPGVSILIDGEARGQSDARGEALLQGLPPGLHEVEVTHPDAGSASPGRVRILEAERSVLRVMLPQRLALGSDIPADRTPTSRDGVAIRIERRGEDVVIAAVVPGSRAARAGLRAGDILLRLDGEAVLSAGTARSVLRGSEGSVRVEVGRGTRRVRRTVARENHIVP